MHAMKLPALPAGAGGAPALLFPVVRESAPVCDIGEETIEIGDKTDIGKAICFWQALLDPGQSMRLRFTDGGRWIGGVCITRDVDDLTYIVDGRIFQGSGDDKGIGLHFVGEGDGPIGLPIVRRDCDGDVVGFYTDEDEDNPEPDAATVKAAFFASGASFTAATAPAVKPESKIGFGAESARQGAALKAAASKAESAWMLTLGRERGRSGGNNGDKWFRYQGKTLVSMAPGETVEGQWPRRMPKPEKRAPEPKVRTAKPAPDAPKAPEKRHVHKRAGKGAPVVALTKVV